MTTAEEARIILEDCELNKFDKLTRDVESRILNAAKDGKEYVTISLEKIKNAHVSLTRLINYLKEYGYLAREFKECLEGPSLIIGW